PRRPGLAAAPFVDLRRAPELAEPYDQGLVQQAALGQVLQKHCVTAVLDRQDAVLEKLEIVPVRVPGQGQTAGKAIETNRVNIDERDTGLDESAGQKAALAEDIASVAIAQPRVFLLQPQCLAGACRGEQFQRTGLKRIHVGGRAGSVRLIESAEKMFPATPAPRRKVRRQLQLVVGELRPRFRVRPARQGPRESGTGTP